VRWGSPDLSFDEVCRTNVPAVYQRFGERLMFVDGRLFDVSSDVAVQVECPPTAQLGGPVGIEYGWQHLMTCDCGCCHGHRSSGHLNLGNRSD